MYTHTTQKQHLTKNHSRHSSRIARKVSRAEQTKEARERNLAVVQLKQALPDKDLPLQKTIGNQAVQKLLQSSAIQAKLKISQPNDKYEQEADRVADQVMRTPDNEALHNQEDDGLIQAKSVGDQITPIVQSQSEFEDEEEKPILTKQAKGETPQASHTIDAQIDSMRGGGQPLPKSVRDFFEPRFGQDFSRTRIHTNVNAAKSAEALNARAFTSGNDIVFDANEYTPSSLDGRRLLAHELTHVVQQNSAGGAASVVQMKPKISQRMGMRVVEKEDGTIEVTANRPWSEGSGSSSTVIGMAHETPGVTVDDLIKELVDCGAYKDDHHVREGFIQGTRIIVKNGKVLEISVRGKVYKAGGVHKPDFNYFLKEGAKIFYSAEFGLTSGEAKGRDPDDGYDSRYWKEKGNRGVIQARIPAWDAMDKMVKNIGKEVPKAGDGKTKWSFDCFEASQVLRLYAIWRTTTRREFNRMYQPLKIGYLSGTKTGLDESILSSGPGEPAYKFVGGKQKGLFLEGATEVTLKKSIIDIALAAPIGSNITFGSEDIRARCNANPNLSMCDLKFEHTIKVGKDLFFAHPFGLVSSETIFREMAKAAGATPSWEYYRKYIYISKVRYPK